MKKLFTFILMLLSFYVSAQKVTAYGGYEYYFNNKTRLTMPLPASAGMGEQIQITHDLGQMCLITGVNYTPVRFFSIGLRADNFFNPIKVDRYMPVQVNYSFNANVSITERIRLEFKHTCLHPVKTSGNVRTEQFGGFRKVGIYFNM